MEQHNDSILKELNLSEDTLAADSPLFGWERSQAESELVIIPAPWEPTTSFKGGTSASPGLIRIASHQMDYFHEVYGYEPYAKGIFYQDVDPQIEGLHAKALKLCDFVQTTLAENVDADVSKEQQEMNELSDKFNHIIYSHAKEILNQGKTPALFGGDHSTPYGVLKALSEKYDQWCVLHVDAHLDLRVAYQGFNHSHASIMYNTSKLPNPPKSLVHVGVRDFSQSEYKYARSNGHKVWTDRKLKTLEFENQSWDQIIDQILQPLSKNVYISFDIDGLDPNLCPGTGTPVPGGLSYGNACRLIEKLAQRTNIIGFDLVEVASPEQDPEDWNCNVGARLLFELCLATLSTKK